MKRFLYFSPLFLQTLIWIPTRIILAVFVRFEVVGLENIEKIAELQQSEKATKNSRGKTGIIFAANHTSELDPILLPAALPFLSPLMPIFYTSRERDFYRASGFRQIFYGGALFKLWGAHPIKAGLKDYEKSLANHVEILKARKSVLIFPEGGIQGHGAVTGKARGGVAFLAAHTDCPIVPVHIIGANEISFSEFFSCKRKIILVFGKPIFDLNSNAQQTFKMLQGAQITQISKIPQTAVATQNTSYSIETYKEIAESVMIKVRELTPEIDGN
jgi:1-acyl-sn-glycerol-3-phosphate acyltransferase